MQLTWLRWGLVALGVVGAALNAVGMAVSFLIWMVANAGLLALNCHSRRWPEAVLFGIYLITAVVGWLVAVGWMHLDVVAA